jgi:hypothetical protein
VGPLTALAFVLIIGRAERFQCGKQIASYLGLVQLEESSVNDCLVLSISPRRAKLMCGDGVFTEWALERGKTVNHFDGVIASSGSATLSVTSSAGPARAGTHHQLWTDFLLKNQ